MQVQTNAQVAASFAAATAYSNAYSYAFMSGLNAGAPNGMGSGWKRTADEAGIEEREFGECLMIFVQCEIGD